MLALKAKPPAAFTRDRMCLHVSMNGLGGKPMLYFVG